LLFQILIELRLIGMSFAQIEIEKGGLITRHPRMRKPITIGTFGLKTKKGNATEESREEHHEHTKHKTT
jgi:hypothetical protein